MKTLLSEKLAAHVLLVMFSLIMVFHLLVLSGVIPYYIAWGGRLKNAEEMYVFESVSLVLNFLMMSMVAVHAGYLKWNINPKVLKVIFWLMAILFFANTVGNLFAINKLETLIFAPQTLILCLFSLRLALGKKVG